MAKKPFQVVRINTPKATGSRKELLAKFAQSKDPDERKKIMHDAIYPNRLKTADEDYKK